MLYGRHPLHPLFLGAGDRGLNPCTREQAPVAIDPTNTIGGTKKKKESDADRGLNPCTREQAPVAIDPTNTIGGTKKRRRAMLSFFFWCR